MPNAHDALLNRGIRHAVYLDQVATGEVDRMVRFMDKQLWPDVRRTLNRRLGALRTSGFDRGVHRTARYKAMMASLDGQINASMAFMSKDAAGRMLRLGMTEAQIAKAMLSESVALDVPWGTPNLQIIRGIVSSRPFHGKILKDWYKDLGAATKRGLRQQINIGLASGEGVPRIAARVMGVRGIESGFMGSSTRAVMRRHVRTIVRTSTNHIANAAREATYKENADIIKGVRWVSTLDARTSDICMSLDGQVFKLGQGERPPAHHQCRSTTVPITKSWSELGLKGAKDVRIGGRAFRDVQSNLTKFSPTRITYGDWLKAQPESVQKQVLGRRRTELFRSGQVKFDRFFRNNRMLSVDQLATLEGVAPLPVMADPAAAGIAAAEADAAAAAAADAAAAAARREAMLAEFRAEEAKQAARRVAIRKETARLKREAEKEAKRMAAARAKSLADDEALRIARAGAAKAKARADARKATPRKATPKKAVRKKPPRRDDYFDDFDPAGAGEAAMTKDAVAAEAAKPLKKATATPKAKVERLKMDVKPHLGVDDEVLAARRAEQIDGITRQIISNDLDEAWLATHGTLEGATEFGLTKYKEVRALVIKRLDELDASVLKTLNAGTLEIRAPKGVFEEILKSGRLKSQFETQSSKGMNNRRLRAQFEKTAFKYKTDVADAARPIYGYANHADVSGAAWRAVEQYGDVRFVLKKAVRKRTTFTANDSLNTWAKKADALSYMPTKITKPSVGAYGNHFAGAGGTPRVALSKAGKITWSREFSVEQMRAQTISQMYTEIQVHGQVTMADIAEIVFPTADSAKKLSSMVDKLGIPWRIEAL